MPRTGRPITYKVDTEEFNNDIVISSFSCKRRQLRRAKQLARRMKRSKSWVVRQALEQYLEQQGA